MRPVKIIAISDLHVCTEIKLAGLSATAPNGEPLVLAQARRSLAWVVDQVLAHRVDFVLVCGDVFESPTPRPAAEEVVQTFVANVRAAGAVPVLLLGNHDRDSGGRRRHALAPLVANVGGPVILDQPGVVELVNEVTGAEVVVYALPYPPRAEIAAHAATMGLESAQGATGAALTNELMTHALEFISAGLVAQIREGWERGETRPQIIACHGTLRGANYGSRKVPEGDPQVSTAGWDEADAAVCGHIHKRQPVSGLPRHLSESHGYVGGLDRYDFGEADQPAGLAVLTFEVQPIGRPVTHVQWVDNPHARRFVDLGVDGVEAAGGDAPSDPLDVPVYRVTGELDEEAKRELVSQVRRLKAAGVLVADATFVRRAERSRAEDLKADMGDDAVLAAVFAADPDLGAHEADIRTRFEEIR